MSNKRDVKKLVDAYYSLKGFFKGMGAIKKLSQITGMSEDIVRDWLFKQAIWQIYLPRPKYIPRPTFDVIKPNMVHQAHLLFLPHDKVGQKTYKHALTVVDIASRYKAAEPLTNKSDEVAKAFVKIYKGMLNWPELLQVDPGSEFMGSVTKLMNDKGVKIRTGNVNIHRDQELLKDLTQADHPTCSWLIIVDIRLCRNQWRV